MRHYRGATTTFHVKRRPGALLSSLQQTRKREEQYSMSQARGDAPLLLVSRETVPTVD